ncbi:tRNA (adenosine(37)-N6)-threonylcarbamoyltransferase complex transferase subunit TsaD [Magnetococcus sp. PR-3]|uniref:tRNA (adenosine(37)-N6)-threonylcarbamoyltransferase complex transferase subunit TsaD n=1 Tax=Magnetococcus sp. PR-3 TaxID=3120355 RepID=UPI002FCDF43E
MSSIGLAIDTTFDDTSVAIIQGHRELLANVTLSQFKDHAEFGGVVPERASRKHLEVIHLLLDQALKTANIEYAQLSWIAVSNTPGLLGSLLVGLTVAKSLAMALDIPLIGINHIESHPYANIIEQDLFPLPVVHLIVAGGHTLLIHQEDHFQWQVIGRSLDDAAGECVDKVAKMYGFPMPGGKAVDQASQEHPADLYRFPRPMLDRPNLDFSFSGLKTALRDFQKANPDAPSGPVFSALLDSIGHVLVEKALRAVRQQESQALTVSGGLAASRTLRKRFTERCEQEGITLYYPSPGLCTDNAAMVACLASYRYAAGQVDGLALEGVANLMV